MTDWSTEPERFKRMLATHGIPITVMSPCPYLGLIHPTGGEGA